MENINDENLNKRNQDKYRLLFEVASNPREEYFSVLIKLLDEKDEWLRLNAVLAISSLGNAKALPFMMERLKIENSDYVTAALLKTMGQLGTKKLLPVIIPFFHHRDGRVVANAVEAVEMIGDRSVSEKLIPLLNHNEPRVRVNSAKALWRFGHLEALDRLTEMLASEENWLRDSVIFALGEINTPQTRKLLCEQLAKEQENIKLKIIDILGRIGDELAVPFLRECLKDKSLRVAEGSQLALAGITLRRGEHQNCTKCGQIIRKNSRFCGHCGAALHE